MGAFDKIVAAVSPRRACEREAWRQQLEILRGYDAAGYPDHFAGGIRMNENDLFNFQLEYTFTADWLAELDRQLALLLSTREGTMPLDRAFGLNMDFVDMPPEAAKSLYTAEVTEKVSKFIPEVRVQEVTWTGGNTGKLFPKVVITSA